MNDKALVHKLRTAATEMSGWHAGNEAALVRQAATRIESLAADAGRLDFVERNRVALVPEYEGPWDAEIYGEEGEAKVVACGTTPRTAIDQAMQ